MKEKVYYEQAPLFKDCLFQHDKPKPIEPTTQNKTNQKENI
jgi:hypothetical protein